MKYIKEENVANIIIINSIFIICSIMFLTSYYFISKQYNEFDKESEIIRKEFYENQKQFIKREVDYVIKLIEFRSETITYHDELTKQLLQNEIGQWVNSIRFGKNNNNYIFVYDVIDLNGGDNFAKMLINPNRPDLVGKYISDEEIDYSGKKFRKIFLEEIRKNNFSFVDYYYKKLDTNNIRKKVSYFKYYQKWNWIIAAGVYLDEVDEVVEQKRSKLKKKIKKEILSTLFLLMLFAFIGIFLSVLLSEKIKRIFKEYKLQVQEKSNELELLNKNLEFEVKKEIEKNREQEQILIQKSKFISLGEMISNIAHQWRQPLSELSSILMNIKFRSKMGKLDQNILDKKTKDAEILLEYMSHTIDDFRNFFMPNKEKQYFSIKESLHSVLNIIGSALKHYKIEIIENIENDKKIYGFQSEYEQVLLNILSNSKDIFIQKKIKEPKIHITLFEEQSYIILSIRDNGGGIQVEPIEKIFEPYFSTKSKSRGTGIGLYMSKIIIEKNMTGLLMINNNNLGAEFLIKIKKEEK